MPDLQNTTRDEAIQLYKQMKERISKTDGVFCQYRPCRRDTNTIYDIENIRNGVIYARSPLYMNDPFDSMIGFSSDALYKEIIRTLTKNCIEDEKTRSIIDTVLEYKALGKIAEFVALVKELQQYLRLQRQVKKKTALKLNEFVLWGHDQLYARMPSGLKKKIKSKSLFMGIGLFFADTDLSSITDDNILDMLQLDDILSSVNDQFDDLKQKTYYPAMETFLKTITVSCFSAGGWDNQLMWSHYAGNYKGICIEYDFTQLDGNTGFVFPVQYSNERPTIKLQDLGFRITKGENGIVFQREKTDMIKILDYLLVKNECWQYEKEWRIINPSEPDTPLFIRFPYIKSITLGLHMDDICRRLLIDVCSEKNIPCYELQLNSDSFTLNRVVLDLNTVNMDLQKDLDYIQFLCGHIGEIGAVYSELDGKEIFNSETGSFNPNKFIELFTKTNDALFSVCCVKQTVSRYMESNNEQISENDIEALRNGIQKINEEITQLDCQPEVFMQAIDVAKERGIVSLNNYKHCKELIIEFATLLPKAKNAGQV